VEGGKEVIMDNEQLIITTVSSQYQRVLSISRHCEEHSDVAIHAKSVMALKDGSPRPDRSGLAMTNFRHFPFDTIVKAGPQACPPFQNRNHFFQSNTGSKS
jgi:hypothetical protein